MLSVEPVGQGKVARFVRYASVHGSEHDDSYLPGSEFRISADQPSYILLRDDIVIGAVSLMRTSRYRQAGRGRFSIFHTTEPSVRTYSLMFAAIRRHFDGLNSVYLFLPESRQTAAESIREIGFSVERYSYVMMLRQEEPVGMVVPEEYTLRTIRATDDGLFGQFADVINASFAGLAGHLPMPADGLREWFLDETYLDDGIALLSHGDKAMGTVCVMRDVENRNAADVSALGVASDHRGRGLGRMLLQHASCFAAWRGLRPVYLSLNAENDRALQLYLSMGFVVTDTVVCYSRDCQAPFPNGD
jgi:mycothiol synthase